MATLFLLGHPQHRRGRGEPDETEPSPRLSPIAKASEATCGSADATGLPIMPVHEVAMVPTELAQASLTFGS